MVSTEVVKVIILFSLLVLTFVCSMLPLIMVRLCTSRSLSTSRRRSCRTTVSLLSCFAAGVFIGICLLDLFPEVEDRISNALSAAGYVTSFPLPEFIVVIGFLLLLIVEQCILTFKTPQSASRLLSGDSLQSSYNSIDNSRTAARPIQGYYEVPTNFESTEGLVSRIADDTGVDIGDVLEEDDANVQQEYTDPSSHSVIRSLILLVALSLHSLLEGVAVGLQETVDQTFRLFFALLLHKCIVAFSVGLNMMQSQLSVRSVVLSNALFSLASPIGIAFGIGIVKETAGITENVVIGTLNGLACGTFIYIVFFEILPHEFMKKHRHTNRIMNVLTLLIGFSVVVAVMFLDPGV